MSATMGDDTIVMLDDAAAAFARPDARRNRALRGSADGFDRARWREMAELGWLTVVVPEAAGGLGLGCRAAATIATRLGQAAFPEPFVAAGIMTPWLLSRASGPVATRALAEVIAGERIAAPAWQNAAGSLDIDACAVRAEPGGGDVSLTGEARFCAPASADAFIVAAQGSDGLSVYWVERDQPGLAVRAEPTADGGALARLTLSDARLPADAMLAGPAEGAGLLRDAIDAGTAACAAELVGLMDQALDMTLGYLRTRKQFGKPIGSFQALQHRAVDIWIQRQLARAAVDAALGTLDAPAANAAARTQAASSAKARAAQAALLLCNQAVQLHGAIGFTDEYDLGIYLHRALGLSAWMGNAAEHRRRWGALADGRLETSQP
jgi:alkylation response protein AidB-like acyl-CoA dehydrogenase